MSRQTQILNATKSSRLTVGVGPPEPNTIPEGGLALRLLSDGAYIYGKVGVKVYRVQLESVNFTSDDNEVFAGNDLFLTSFNGGVNFNSSRSDTFFKCNEDKSISTTVLSSEENILTLNATGGVRITENGAIYVPSNNNDITNKLYVDNQTRYVEDYRICNYYENSGVPTYIPLVGYVIDRTSSSSAGEYITMIMPHDGTVERMFWRSERAMSGSMRVAIYRNGDGTEVPTTAIGRKTYSISIADDTTEEISLDPAGLDKGYEDNSFSKGEIIAISINPPAAPYDTYCTVVFKYDLNN